MTEPLELTALPETVEVCPGRSYERSIRKPRRSVDHNKDIRQYTDKMASTHVEINGLGAQICGTGRDAFRQVKWGMPARLYAVSTPIYGRVELRHEMF